MSFFFLLDPACPLVFSGLILGDGMMPLLYHEKLDTLSLLQASVTLHSL